MSVETSTETIRAVNILPDYRLSVTFMDGVQGIADLSALVKSETAGRYTALADRALFGRATLELGAITWPNGADLDPSWLYDEISKSGEWKAA